MEQCMEHELEFHANNDCIDPLQPEGQEQDTDDEEEEDEEDLEAILVAMREEEEEEEDYARTWEEEDESPPSRRLGQLVRAREALSQIGSHEPAYTYKPRRIGREIGASGRRQERLGQLLRAREALVQQTNGDDTAREKAPSRDWRKKPLAFYREDRKKAAWKKTPREREGGMATCTAQERLKMSVDTREALVEASFEGRCCAEI